MNPENCLKLQHRPIGTQACELFIFLPALSSLHPRLDSLYSGLRDTKSRPQEASSNNLYYSATSRNWNQFNTVHRASAESNLFLSEQCHTYSIIN